MDLPLPPLSPNNPQPEVIYTENSPNRKRVLIWVIGFLILILVSFFFAVYFGFVDFKKFFGPKYGIIEGI